MGNFKIIREVGEGGMAIAYLAHHKEIPDHRVILKLLKDPRHGEKFKKEANNLAKLNDHHNICRIYDYFNDGARTVIVMEYIEGATLKDVIESEKILPMNLFLKLGIDLIRIMKYAHERKMYHRDLKPGNIMVDKQGEIKIIDFGIAKDATDPSETAAGMFSGTPLFAPIEQFNPMGAIDWPKTDIYALGTTLYLMITGRMPFDGDSWEEYAENKRLAEPYSPSKFNPEVSKKLDAIILKSIARMPQDRYNTLGEMLTEIEPLRTERIVEPQVMDRTVDVAHYPGVTQAPESGARWGDSLKSDESKSNRKPLMISLAAAVVVIVTVSYLYFGTELFSSTNELQIPQNPLSSSTPAIVPQESGSMIPAKGELEISAEPNADVYLNDSLIGNALKSQIIELDSGQYQVVFENQKAVTGKKYQETASVLPGQLSKVSHTFTMAAPPAVSSPGTMTFNISPKGDIFVDNVRVATGKSNFDYRTKAGEFEIKVVNSSPGIDSTIIERVRVISDETMNLNYSFNQKLTQGFVRVGSWPPKATVFINDKEQSQPTPFTFTLPAGTYNVRVWVKDKDLSRDSNLVVVPGDTIKFAPEFE